MTIMEEVKHRDSVTDMSPMKEGKSKILVKDLNPQITCPLCGGYFIDATTVTECLHTFCRTCIVSYLDLSEYCPVCDVTVHGSKPLLGIRQDRLLQDLVYKLVPGLFTSELERKKEFYNKNPRHFALDSIEPTTQEQHTDLILDNEQISISLEFQDRLKSKGKSTPEECTAVTDGEVLDKRYLLCPAKLTISVLEKFIRAKFGIPATYQVEFYHTSEPLREHYTMRDLAYIYSWQKTAPFKLCFTAFEVLQKDTSDILHASDTQTKNTTPLPHIDNHINNHGHHSDIESTDSDCSDATYLPPVVQIKQEPDAMRRPRGRPHKRRGTKRLMFSQRGWDSHLKRQKRQPTGRPRGRPRKHVDAFVPSRDAHQSQVSATTAKRPRGWPKGKPRKQKELSTVNNQWNGTSRANGQIPKRPRGRPRKEFQPRFCSTPNSIPLLRTVKQEVIEDSWQDHQQHEMSVPCKLPIPTSIKRRICSLPECNNKSTKGIKFTKRVRHEGTATDKVTSSSRNVGRVHWIYRKRKMPIPSIPVSLKLNKNELDELVRNNRPEDPFLSPHRREPQDSASWSSEDSNISHSHSQSRINNSCNNTLPMTSTVTRSVQSQNAYNPIPALLSNIATNPGISSYSQGHTIINDNESFNESTPMQNMANAKQTQDSNATSIYSQVNIKDINRQMVELQSSSNINYTPTSVMATHCMEAPSEMQPHELLQRDDNLSKDDPCEAVLRSMSKHRLLYLLKRCTEQPTHSLHESVLLGQRRGKEGDSLEEDYLEEKPASPIVEQFRPLNISLQ